MIKEFRHPETATTKGSVLSDRDIKAALREGRIGQLSFIQLSTPSEKIFRKQKLPQ